nr:GvpL/GvpF family gas vesicle protein [Streptomyces sp. CB01881]
MLLESPQARRLNEEIVGGDTTPELPLALGELVAQEVRARHYALATGITEALRPHARQEVNSEPTGEDFLNVSFRPRCPIPDPRCKVAETDHGSGVADDVARLGSVSPIICSLALYDWSR